jgi:hypothetical protein
MAYQTAALAPFTPCGFQQLLIQGRKAMVRAVSRRAPPTHEDWAILFIEPLPLDEVHYANIRDVSIKFLLQHKCVRLREMQKSHLGQALMRFEHIYDRDNLIAQSPHAYGNLTS